MTSSDVERRRMLSRKEAARCIGVSVSTLYRWARRKDRNGLPIFKRGRVIRYRPQDVDSFIENGIDE